MIFSFIRKNISPEISVCTLRFLSQKKNSMMNKDWFVVNSSILQGCVIVCSTLTNLYMALLTAKFTSNVSIHQYSGGFWLLSVKQYKGGSRAVFKSKRRLILQEKQKLKRVVKIVKFFGEYSWRLLHREGLRVNNLPQWCSKHQFRYAKNFPRRCTCGTSSYRWYQPILWNRKEQTELHSSENAACWIIDLRHWQDTYILAVALCRHPPLACTGFGKTMISRIWIERTI